MSLSKRIQAKKAEKTFKVSGKMCKCGRANSSFAKKCTCGKKLS